MVRYATIITDDDGREVVSAIGEFEGAAPQPRLGRVEQVVPGVLIGMLRGGPVDAVGGFGFAQGSLGSSDRAIGAARLMSRLRLAGQSDAAASGAGRSEAARPAGATDAKLSAKPARAASKPRKRAARLKSKAAKSARSKSRMAKPRTAKSAAKPAEAGHG
ncbi:hypothetical protein [Mesorhizobium kowhaii]|uniref:Uncharacterized protein n=1 Tax=Mesorhizobium kowhaii TaxID=1300272 RepID=A0A2W7CAM4_9HYPH|nr:hypothetical protein [Mesorhizobium kowhaii]PZV40077.1 hypothetical protein B5V02_07535 [Mesorhizobium kowhaii]